MSLDWYLKRLGRMTGPEIAFRVGEQVKRAVSRRRAYGWEAFPPLPLLSVPDLAGALRSGLTEDLEATLRQAAGDLSAGHFAAHGVAWPRRSPPEAFPPDVWTLDPVTGAHWPGAERFCFDIGYRHQRDLGDVKFVWDFNRLQFLQPLAAAVALFDDAAALKTIEGAISGWWVANPPFRGIGWNSGIELALRAVTLVIVQSLCGERLLAGTREKISAILRAHLYWLRRYPSRFSSANNHLVAELLGEFAIALVLPAEPGASELVKTARARLEAEALKQILPDGTGAEQSPTYGAFTAEMLLIGMFLAKAFGQPLAESLAVRLRAFVDHVAWLSDGRGRVPAIGDDDEGRVLSLCGPREYSYPASIARCIESFLALPPAVARSSDTAELRHAFFAGGRAVPALPGGIRSFEEGGYTIVRERRGARQLHLVVDHGPLGFLSIAAHGHADANAFTLALDEEPVLVDPGTYLYHSGGAWRDWFRGTRAHNTVALAGADQSIIAGPFNWSKKANARLIELREGPDWRVSAAHDGYSDRFGCEHVRTIEAAADGILIKDRLQPWSSALPTGEVSFQFAPGLEIQDIGTGHLVLRSGQPILRITFSQQGSIEKIEGGDHAQGGWVSWLFGDKMPALRLVWRGSIPEQGLQTRFFWSMPVPG